MTIRWSDSETTAKEVLATWGYRLHLVDDPGQIPGYVWYDQLHRTDPAARTFREVRQDGRDIWVWECDFDFFPSLWHEVGHAGAVGRAGHAMVNWQPRGSYNLGERDDDAEFNACAWTAALLAVVGAPLNEAREALQYVGAEDYVVYQRDRGYVGIRPPLKTLRAALAWQRAIMR